MRNNIIPNLFLLLLFTLSCKKESKTNIIFQNFELNKEHNNFSLLKFKANRLFNRPGVENGNDIFYCISYKKNFDFQEEDSSIIIHDIIIREVDSTEMLFESEFQNKDIVKILLNNKNDSCITCKIFFIPMFGKPTYTNPIYISKKEILNALNE